MRNTLKVIAAAAGLALASAAQADVTVGGIVFTGALPGGSHLETATLAQTLPDALGFAKGYGYITTVNGATNYCAGAGTCSLYYTFTNYHVESGSIPAGGLYEFSGGIINLYYSASPALNLLTQDSNANWAAISAMTPWVQLLGHNSYDNLLNKTGSLTGVSSLVGNLLTENGQGLVDVNTLGWGMADVAAFLNGNGISDNCAAAGAQIGGPNGCAAHVDGYADIQITSSTSNRVLNAHDVTNGLAVDCQNFAGNPTGWCMQGTLNARGDVVIPEPATLALVGLGLLGAGLARRRVRP